jgi:hypothetical protein
MKIISSLGAEVNPIHDKEKWPRWRKIVGGKNLQQIHRNIHFRNIILGRRKNQQNYNCTPFKFGVSLISVPQNFNLINFILKPPKRVQYCPSIHTLSWVALNPPKQHNFIFSPISIFQRKN